MKPFFEKLFAFDSQKHTIRTEILAGLTTFLTMAYILAVNPSIFSALDMPKGAVFTATALAALIGTLVMALYAKKPFALAPGMGLNAFFVFTVCLTMGHSWQFALTAVFLEGIIFIILTRDSALAQARHRRGYRPVHRLHRPAERRHHRQQRQHPGRPR